MGLFGKPAPASNVGSASGKTNASSGPHNGPKSNQKQAATASGKNTAKANAGEGGKAFGSPTSMSGISGTGFEPAQNGGGDRWSYGGGSDTAHAGEWSSGYNDQADGGVWQRDGWNGPNERRDEW